MMIGEHGRAARAAEKAPDRTHAAQVVAVLFVDHGDETLAHLIDVADNRNALHDPVDEIVDARAQVRFDDQTEQIDQRNDDDDADQVGDDRGVDKAQADRRQNPAEPALRPNKRKQECRNPRHQYCRHRDRQQHEQTCQQSPDQRGHRSSRS
jgi:hypothetical protein